MRFTYAEAMTDPSYYIPLAQAAEAGSETAVKAAKKIGWGGAVLIAAAILAALLVVMAGGLRLAPITPQGRMFLEARASHLCGVPPDDALTFAAPTRLLSPIHRPTSPYPDAVSSRPGVTHEGPWIAYSIRI